MNYKKFLTGLFVMTVLLVALFLFVGCNGNDCGYNCDGGPACGLACNGHGGCVGNAFCDGCTPIGVTICDSCGSCVGLGVDGGRLNMSADKNTYITTDTVFIKGLVMESNGSTYANYSEAVFISITNDTTGKAKIKRVDGGFELTTSSPGSVTVEGKLGDYSDSITIEFVDAEQVLANFKLTINKPQETMYVGNNYQLSVRGNNTIISINQDAVQYTLSENDAMVGISGTTIRAEKEGSVKIQASYTVGDKVFKAEETFNFSPAILKLAIKNQQCIGDKVSLSYTIEPSSIYHNDPSYISYAVVGGTATVSRDPSNNNIWYIIATERGDVELKLTYNNGNAVVTSNVTMTFTNQGFTISAASDALFVGYDIPLSATSNLAGFNVSTVQYRVVEGDAIIKVVEGVNKLYVNTPGTVKVAATYDHNGAVLDSNELVLTLDYDENTIRTPIDLQKLVNSEVTFNLIADLDLSSYTNWTPIEGFKGTLRGNGHTISGLNIRAANLETNKGLFGHLEGTVENLNINGTITANGEVSKIGLLCGYSTGKINNVTASGTISAEYSSTVGGVVGSSENSNVTDCTSSVNIHAKDNVGGVVGYMAADRSSAAIISGNTNTGTVRGNSNVGGVFGSVLVKSANNSDEILMTKNENNGAVSATGNNVGGIVGWARGESHDVSWEGTYTSPIKITECTNSAEISGVDSVGGIAGYCEANVSEMSFCTNTGDISGNIQVGGYAGYANGTTMRNLSNSQTITGKAYLGGIAGYCGKIDSCINAGTLTVVGYYHNSENVAISCVGGIAGQATSAVNCINNNKSIDASNGGRYVGGIAGLINATRSSSAEFKNNQNLAMIVGKDSVGGIFGGFMVERANSNETILISTNTNNADITGMENNIGGIVGWVSGEAHDVSYEGTYSAKIKITDCTNTGGVSGVNWVGGIVGDASAHVEEVSFSFNEGSVEGNLYVGGYAGRGEGTTMRNLKNNNHITGKAYIGGIAGIAGRLDTCENNGTITNVHYYLDTNNNTALSYVGGIAGMATSATNCTNNSVINVVNGGHYVGGIVGYVLATRTDDDSYFTGNKNHGDVSGNWYVGGIFGEFAAPSINNNVTISVKSNTNDGSVSGANYVGGIVGHAKGESHHVAYEGTFTARVKFIENTNDANIIGNDYVGGIIGSGSAYVSELITCTHTGDVEGTLYVGGYAGYSVGTAMRNLTNNSTITGKAYIGGIAGYCGKLENCTNNGAVINRSHQLTDSNEAVSYAGGLAGYATGAASCTNNADVDISSGGNYVGGIVGYVEAIRSADSPISGNKNYGAVTGTNYVGGMFGVVVAQHAHNNDTIDIKDNTNEGYVDASGNYVGGIAGLVKGESHHVDYEGTYTSNIKVTGCNNDSDVTGADYVGGIVGYCETLVVADDVVWGTNVVGGEVISDGENKGNYYGKLS